MSLALCRRHGRYPDNHNYQRATQYPVVERVFVISQIMGNNVFHFLTENLPRLGLYHSELLADPTIKVHVVTNDEGTDNSKLHLVPKYIKSFMHFLGIPDTRLTFGAIQAKVGVCSILVRHTRALGCTQRPVMANRRRLWCDDP